LIILHLSGANQRKKLCSGTGTGKVYKNYAAAFEGSFVQLSNQNMGKVISTIEVIFQKFLDTLKNFLPNIAYNLIL
jgi:hypothetical protein